MIGGRAPINAGLKAELVDAMICSGCRRQILASGTYTWPAPRNLSSWAAIASPIFHRVLRGSTFMADPAQTELPSMLHQRVHWVSWLCHNLRQYRHLLGRNKGSSILGSPDSAPLSSPESPPRRGLPDSVADGAQAGRCRKSASKVASLKCPSSSRA